MSQKFIFSVCAMFFMIQSLFGSGLLNQDHVYRYSDDPIDVVIMAAPKDYSVLHFCIEGIKRNVQNLRRIIVVSPTQCSNEAEWFDERLFPFTKEQVLSAIYGAKEEWVLRSNFRNQWYFQQLLKLYAPLVIPNISQNVLITDAVVVFLKPLVFQTELLFLQQELNGILLTSCIWRSFFLG